MLLKISYTTNKKQKADITSFNKFVTVDFSYSFGIDAWLQNT